MKAAAQLFGDNASGVTERTGEISDDLLRRVERLESQMPRSSPAEAQIDVLAYWVNESFASATELQRIQGDVIALGEKMSALSRQFIDQVAAFTDSLRVPGHRNCATELSKCRKIK
jgi:hypothetical protein